MPDEAPQAEARFTSRFAAAYPNDVLGPSCCGRRHPIVRPLVKGLLLQMSLIGNGYGHGQGPVLDDPCWILTPLRCCKLPSTLPARLARTWRRY
jgi:hypothetical protein